MMPKMRVERVWKHKSNLCVVVMGELGHRCGYVGIQPTHPLYKVNYSSDVELLHKKKEALLHEEIGKRGIIPILCWDGEKVSPEILFNVHGGITYSGGNNYPINIAEIVGYQPWWFGYDCGHSGDGRDLSVLDERMQTFYSKYPEVDEVRTLEYCIGECESLSDQLEELYPE
jgi:hypothetical protein